MNTLFLKMRKQLVVYAAMGALVLSLPTRMYADSSSDTSTFPPEYRSYLEFIRSYKNPLYTYQADWVVTETVFRAKTPLNIVNSTNQLTASSESNAILSTKAARFHVADNGIVFYVSCRPIPMGTKLVNSQGYPLPIGIDSWQLRSGHCYENTYYENMVNSSTHLRADTQNSQISSVVKQHLLPPKLRIALGENIGTRQPTPTPTPNGSPTPFSSIRRDSTHTTFTNSLSPSFPGSKDEFIIAVDCATSLTTSLLYYVQPAGRQRQMHQHYEISAILIDGIYSPKKLMLLHANPNDDDILRIEAEVIGRPRVNDPNVIIPEMRPTLHVTHSITSPSRSMLNSALFQPNPKAP